MTENRGCFLIQTVEFWTKAQPLRSPLESDLPGGDFWGLSLTHRPLERMFQNVRMEGQTYVKISK